jgi:hypothetical protein
MATAFQKTAFQNNAFQIDDVVVPPAEPTPEVTPQVGRTYRTGTLNQITTNRDPRAFH